MVRGGEYKVRFLLSRFVYSIYGLNGFFRLLKYALDSVKKTGYRMCLISREVCLFVKV